jgi:putative proteasome-type protease
MTFCIGIKIKSGLLALADTRISTAGGETYTNKKLSVHRINGFPMFVMTAGLRSVRDKSITYFKHEVEDAGVAFKYTFEAANAFGELFRRVAREDKAALVEEGYRFNCTAIIGGQMASDQEHKLYLIFPEGNWIEISEGLLFQIIGNTNYGKPLLYRSLTYESSIEEALKLAFLAFDSTRVSANDVDFPLDVVLYQKDSFEFVEYRLEREDLAQISEQWAALLKDSLGRIPNDWMNPLVSKLK